MTGKKVKQEEHDNTRGVKLCQIAPIKALLIMLLKINKYILSRLKYNIIIAIIVFNLTLATSLIVIYFKRATCLAISYNICVY